MQLKKFQDKRKIIKIGKITKIEKTKMGKNFQENENQKIRKKISERIKIRVNRKEQKKARKIKTQNQKN